MDAVDFANDIAIDVLSKIIAEPADSELINYVLSREKA